MSRHGVIKKERDDIFPLHHHAKFNPASQQAKLTLKIIIVINNDKYKSF